MPAQCSRLWQLLRCRENRCNETRRIRGSLTATDAPGRESEVGREERICGPCQTTVATAVSILWRRRHHTRVGYPARKIFRVAARSCAANPSVLNDVEVHVSDHQRSRLDPRECQTRCDPGNLPLQLSEDFFWQVALAVSPRSQFIECLVRNEAGGGRNAAPAIETKRRLDRKMDSGCRYVEI